MSASTRGDGYAVSNLDAMDEGFEFVKVRCCDAGGFVGRDGQAVDEPVRAGPPVAR